MNRGTWVRRLAAVAGFVAASFAMGADAEIDPAIAAYRLPDQIKWTDNPSGASSAVLLGDPAKPGLYITLVRWHPHHMSRPHFHPNDRFITVLSGTWWVGTGDVFDTETTVPMPAGTYVTHFGGKIHYDGAKDEECVLEIVGMGPATSTPAEHAH